MEILLFCVALPIIFGYLGGMLGGWLIDRFDL